MSGFVFNAGALELLGTGSWTGDTIRARLVTTAAGAPSVDATSMTSIGLDAGTYPNCTCTLGTKVGPTKDDTNDLVKFSSANALFASAESAVGACNRMVIFKFVTNDAGSTPLACVEIGEVDPIGSDVTVTCPTNGWFATDQQP
jgi:hypothetical protein